MIDINYVRFVPEKKTLTYSSKVVYGPIISRRSLHSFGINVWPDKKVCSFDCRYCHCGKSTRNTKNTMPFQKMKEELEAGFKFHAKFNNFIQDIVVEGNGEPTLFPQFYKATTHLLKLRDNFFPNIPLVLFTNATNLEKPEVIRALLKYDQVFFKLDAAEEKIVNRLNGNRKHIDYILGDIEKVANLIKTGRFTLKNFEISTAVAGSKIGNYESLFRDKFVDTIIRLDPQKIYLYDIDRVAPGEELDFVVSKKQLFELANYIFKKTNVEVIAIQSQKGRGIHELSEINSYCG